MIKVAIYEDNHGLRDVLASIIRETDGFELAGEFAHCIDVVKNTEVFLPDVIIMDIDLPGKNGIEAVKELSTSHSKVEIIMHTVFDDDDRIFNAIKAGATGYLLKKNSLARLIEAIKEVHSGGAPMSPGIARKVLKFQQDNTGTEANMLDLSEREYEVLSLLSKGNSYKMVAEEIGLSLDTIRSYIKRIYEKLHVHSVTEAIHKVFIEKK